MLITLRQNLVDILQMLRFKVICREIENPPEPQQQIDVSIFFFKKLPAHYSCLCA